MQTKLHSIVTAGLKHGKGCQLSKLSATFVRGGTPSEQRDASPGQERLYVGRPAQWTPPEYQLQCGGRAPPSGPPADSPAPDDWGGWLQEIASSGLAEWHQRRTWQNEKPKRTDRAKWKSAEKVGRTEREEQTKGGKGQAEEC
ncbi:hypothetical protein AGIG_G312 [Arapaima gigas]